jgi:hypothetical protein
MKTGAQAGFSGYMGRGVNLIKEFHLYYDIHTYADGGVLDMTADNCTTAAVIRRVARRAKLVGHLSGIYARTIPQKPALVAVGS